MNIKHTEIRVHVYCDSATTRYVAHAAGHNSKHKEHLERDFVCFAAIRWTTNSEHKGKFGTEHDMKAYGWVKLWPHSFLISATERSVYLHSPTALAPEKAPSVPIHCEDRWAPETFEKKKPPCPSRE